MKIVKYFALMVAAVATLVSCEGPNNGGTDVTEGTFKVTASATTIYADGKDAVTFTATLDGVPVEAAEVEAYDAKTNNLVVVDLTNLVFKTNTPGEYEFYFKYGEHKSNIVKITAVDAKLSKLDLSDVEGQEGLSVMTTSTVFQRGEEAVYIIVRKDGKVVNDANKIKFYLSGSDNVEITDTDFQMVDYVDANDDLYTLPQYTPAEVGVRDIWVSYGSANTINKPIRITAVDFEIPSRAIDTDPENTSFKRRSLLNQFTGTDCPNCPYMSSAIKDLMQDAKYSDKFVLAAAHTYNNDPVGADYSLALQPPYTSLANTMGASTYPTILLDMHYSYGNNGRSGNKQNIMKYIDNAQLTAAKAGLSARSSIEGSTVIARLTVKAHEAGEYRVGAWLVEDGIKATQSNNSGIFDYDFDIHEAVIRIADSRHDSGGQLRYRGHSVGNLEAGQVADHVFTMELDGKWNADNCRLVFFVTAQEDAGVYVANAVETSALNATIEFEYK